METTPNVGDSKIPPVGPVDLQLILSPSINLKIKIQFIQQINDVLKDCCQNQKYFDTMIFVFVKLLTSTEPVFTPENDQFKMRKLITEIVYRICNDTHNKDKLKCHIQNLMRTSLKIIKTDNEECVMFCIYIYRDLLTIFQPKFEGYFKTEILNFFNLVMDIYRNSSTTEKIFTQQKSTDLKVLISTIRHSTVIQTSNSVSFNIIPMGRVSFKVIKELTDILKLFYVLYHDIDVFLKDILEFVPVLMQFFNLDIPYKPDYRDLVLDLKHAQAKLLSFFSIILREHKEEVHEHCSSLAGRLISLLNCNISSDESSLRLELLSGLEYVILSDYKSEFLPYLDQFIEETLITGRNWSLKQTLRPRSFIYVDHLITNLHTELSSGFLICVINWYLSNILDPSFQPEFQLNLLNMVMNVLNFINQKLNIGISKLNSSKKFNLKLDLFYRVLHIFIRKLKQFQTFYLPLLDRNILSQNEVKENMSSILKEYQLDSNQEFMYGYHSSQIDVYTLYDSKRFINIIIPGIRTIFQLIVRERKVKFRIVYNFKKLLKTFIKYSLLSLKVCNCPNNKKDMVKEILTALSCVNPKHLKVNIERCDIIKLIYAERLDKLIFDIALNDEVLVYTFSRLIFEFVIKNFLDKTKSERIIDLLNRLQLNFSNINVNDYIYKVLKMLKNNIQHTTHIIFNITVTKKIFAIVQSANYKFSETMNSFIINLFSDLLSYHHNLPNSLVFTKTALSELCLAECIFKVVPHTKIIDFLPVVAYSLQTPELISRGLFFLERFVAILPANFIDNPLIKVRSEIFTGLHNCLDNPSESNFHSAMRLLGKLGKFNRSLVNSYQLHANKDYDYDNKSSIFISFEHFNHNLIDVEIGPGVNTALETLISSSDRFNRVHSWYVIKGFLIASWDFDLSEIIKTLENMNFEKQNWTTFVDIFLKNNKTYIKTSFEDIYVKALTGLMICCSDEYLQKDALQYFCQLVKVVIMLSLCHFSNIPYKYSLTINPNVLIDGFIKILSQEKYTIYNFGIQAIQFFIKELRNIIGCSIVNFPLVTYMVKQCYELCYDISWICKRGGCFGLQVLLTLLLKEDMIEENYHNWFIEYFISIFTAKMFLFDDCNKQLTFGTLEVAKYNLNLMIKWLYWTKPIISSHEYIKAVILKHMSDNIVGPNDLLRDLSIDIVISMARIEQTSVSDIFISYHENFRSAIPGNELFSKYTFKTQLGIMKGHIFCSLFGIFPNEFELSKWEHMYYFNRICVVCQKNDKQIKKMPTYMSCTSKDLLEFRKTAMQVLVNCIGFTKCHEKKMFKLILNILLCGINRKLHDIVFHCLKHQTQNIVLIKMANKMYQYYIQLYKKKSRVTSRNMYSLLILTKLFPNISHKHEMSVVVTKIFRKYWFFARSNKYSKTEIEYILTNILDLMFLSLDTLFRDIISICEIVVNAKKTLYIELTNKLTPRLIKCVSKFPEEFILYSFTDKNLKNKIWMSFFNFVVCSKLYDSVRKELMSYPSYIEHILELSKTDPFIQYESIKIIYSLTKINKNWIIEKELADTLIDIWSNTKYKNRYNNLLYLELNHWDEPKMLLKILLGFFKNNTNEIIVLFHLVSAFSCRFPVDINFFRLFIENEIINKYSIMWKQNIFFKFMELYQSKDISDDILGRILQYLILPSFSFCYKQGLKEQLLCKFTNPDENIIGVVLNKIFTNIEVALTGCDFDGVKVFLCQLICLLFKDLISSNENISDLVYNAISNCKQFKCTMDLNVKYHCNLILIFLMLSGNTPKSEKQYQAIYDELLKCSSVEALPVIRYSLSLIVTAALKNNIEVNSLIECVKNSIMSESHNLHTLHHILFFIKKYNTLFYPYKEDMAPLILKSLLPVAKNNNIADYKKTAMELACLIVDWELDINENMLSNYDREPNNASMQLKKSSVHIEDALNFLAKVACQTYDDKHDSKISRLAIHSDILFKNILSKESLDSMEVKLKLKWLEKILETFLKKELVAKENPNKQPHTNSNVLSLLAIFEMISFLLKVLSQKFMLDVIISIEDYLIQFLQLVFNEGFSENQNTNKIVTNRLSASQAKQCNEGTLKVITDVLNTFSTIEGLEKLHTFVQMIITEGLNSNCSHKLEVSLTLLHASLLHFSYYMDSDILSTIGEIAIKFNENNSNSLIKVKCLDILQIHFDTLPRNGKLMFIEKVVIQNLDSARDDANNIPFEVQVKCFELIITFVKDIPEETKEVILNTTFLEYIKTTTDERIMTIILNVITKWIEICRDESVKINHKIINILKCITIINRFPSLTDYCYVLNLEIFKYSNIRECIEFGLNCKTSQIRYNFLNYLVTLWIDGGLCARLGTIMSDEFNYDLECSIAFYIQLFFVKINKNTKLQGDFPILYKLSNDVSENSVIHDSLKLFTLCEVSTFEMCSSLAQLCFIDINLAKNTWTSLLPSIWNIFSNNQKTLLTEKAVNFLVNSKLKNDLGAAFYESITLCHPKIKFEPRQMVYIGKTYSLWYKIINQLEDLTEYFDYKKKNEAIEGLIQMYSFLQEDDVLEYLFKISFTCQDTKYAYSLERQGFYKNASKKYIKLLNSEINQTKFYHNNTTNNNFSNKEIKFSKIRLIKCLKELNNWSYLSDSGLEQDNLMLEIESKWRKSIGNATNSLNLRCLIEQKLHIWPSTMIWKYHFYLAMLGLNQFNHQVMSIVQEHIILATNAIVDKWKNLPKYLCNAHTNLLQATQLIFEIQEAHDFQKSWFQSPRNVNNFCKLNETWYNRKLWIGDNLNVCNDFISWRQTYYSFLIQHSLNTKTLDLKCVMDQSKLLFIKIALMQNMTETCLNELLNFNPSYVNTPNMMYKMFLEAKSVQTIKKYNNIKFNGDFNSCILLYEKFPRVTKPIEFIIKGILHGNQYEAFNYFANGFFDLKNSTKSNNIKWRCVIQDNYINNIFTPYIPKCPNYKNCLTTRNNTEILEVAWTQWATLIENYYNHLFNEKIKFVKAAMQCYIIASELTDRKNNDNLIAKILWLLTYDNEHSKLLKMLKHRNITYSDLWIPQILNIFVEQKKKDIEKCMCKFAKIHPQKLYLTLNRMHLTEILNKKRLMETSVNNNKIRYIETATFRIKKIKRMIKLSRKYNSDSIQLDYFINEINALDESWDEELLRLLYHCLYFSYDYAYSEKTLNVQLPNEIKNLIKTMLISFVAQDVNTEKLNNKRSFLVPDYLSKYYYFLKDKFPKDFSLISVFTVGSLLKVLRKWIYYIESKCVYPSKFVHGFRNPTLNNIDWSRIRLPSDNYTDDSSKMIGIYSFSGYVYTKNRAGTIVKQLTIRGTDGFLYTYHISKGINIDSEERIFQLFHIANGYLRDFKGSAKRFLNFTVPRTFTVSNQLRMVEYIGSTVSLLEIYQKPTSDTILFNEDIELWFDVLEYCINYNKILPLKNAFETTWRKSGSNKSLKNWVLSKYSSHSDYFVFRKTFIEGYSLMCFFEFAFNLMKLNPEMLNIVETNGKPIALYYTFKVFHTYEYLFQHQIAPFRMTPNIYTFITPLRKYQVVNCITETNHCIANCFDNFSSVLKLLLKEDINKYKMNMLPKKQLLILINDFFVQILKNLQSINNTQDPDAISKLFLISKNAELLYNETPTWRPWV